MRELGLRRFVDFGRYARLPFGYARFYRDLRRYRRMAPGTPVPLSEAWPQIYDRTATTRVDRQYFHQDVWAARRVVELGPERHVDVASRVDYAGFLTAVTQVTFVDMRPLAATLEGLTPVEGDILDLPFADRSVESLSCLNVAEHIGLGRYGDELDPDGTAKAARELQRVLAPGGQLLFSVPVGRPRICFNAHRVLDPTDVRGMFEQLNLVEFAGVDDGGDFRRHRELDDLAGGRYGCGLFHLTRPARATRRGPAAH